MHNRFVITQFKGKDCLLDTRDLMFYFYDNPLPVTVLYQVANYLEQLDKILIQTPIDFMAPVWQIRVKILLESVVDLLNQNNITKAT